MRPALFSVICMISAYSVHLCAYEVTARNDSDPLFVWQRESCSADNLSPNISKLKRSF